MTEPSAAHRRSTDRSSARTDLPTGTVTFLRTDVEGSMAMAGSLGTRWDEINAAHLGLIRRAVDRLGGATVRTEGDALFAVFPEAGAAVSAAIEAQRALAAHSWPDDMPIAVRIGIHSGEAHLAGDDYGGFEVSRAARIAAAGHGGQIVLSEATRTLVEPSLPEGVSIRDLGRHALKDVPRPERLYQLDVPGLRTAFPPLRSQDARSGNLPPRLTSFVGRTGELDELRRLLATSRLVTITGPGGTGKSSLAIAVAEAVADDFPDGTWFVPLESVADPALVPAAAVRALRLELEDRRPPADRLVDFLRDRQLLLVFDNFEHLSSAAAFVQRLLEEAPGVRLLVASQVPLHLAGEQEYPLAPLPVPAPGSGPAPEDAAGSPSVQLFVERARAVRPAFDLATSDAAAVAQICVRLDGMPLAIELAAAQVRLLTPRAILDRLATRIDQLVSQRADAPARQRTLDAAVSWSYDLLAPPEQALLRRMSVFAGSADLEAIESLVADDPAVPDPIGALSTVVDRSLVRAHSPVEDRYSMLETIRSFAAGKLRAEGESQRIERRHAEVFAALAERAEPEVYRAHRRAWLDRLTVDHDNVRAALDRTEACGEIELAVRLGAALWRFWQQRGHIDEAMPRMDRLLGLAHSATTELPPDLMSRAEEAAGGMEYWRRLDVQPVERHYARALELARRADDPALVAWALYNLAYVYDYLPAGTNVRADVERADALRNDALRRFREIGDRRGEAYSLWGLGGSPLSMTKAPEECLEQLHEALALCRQIGDVFGETWALMSTSMLEAVRGRFDEARTSMAAAANLFVRDGDVAGVIVSLDSVSALAARGGEPRLAVRLHAATLAIAAATGARVPPIPILQEPIELARASLTAEEIEHEEAVGRTLSVAEALVQILGGMESARRAMSDFERSAGDSRQAPDQ